MTTEELLKNHPKTTTLIKKWMAERMTENTESLSEEFKEYVKTISLDDAYLIPIINANPRNLLDIFDENEIYIHILPKYPIASEGMKFMYDDGNGVFKPYKTRKEAERVAIEEAFEILEKKL